MRLTAPRFKHNLWRQLTATWRVQSKRRKILDIGLKDKLEKNNLVVYDAMDIAAVPEPHLDELRTLQIPPVTKPDTEQEDAKKPIKTKLLAFRDNNVLMEGMDQAKRLTNTIEPEPGVLPQQLTSLIDVVKLPQQDDLAKRCILSSIAFDAEQVKLPIRKNPLKRMWVFPRDYGISQPRRSRLLNSRLLQLCETISSSRPAPHDRLIARDARFSVPLHWGETPFLLDVTADLLLLTSSGGLPPAAPVSAAASDGPPPFPSYISPLISLEETDFTTTKFEDNFPIKTSKQGPAVHTAIVNFDKERVKNLYGTEVLPPQITSRSLMKAFAFSVAQARHIHGDKFQGELPTPITTQLIQTDGRWFHFSVMQLNTTNIQDTNMSNFFWSLPIFEMFGPTSGYEDGKPVIHDYDSRVLKTMLAFYNNGS